MQIHLHDPTMLSDLLRFLEQRPDVITERTGEHEALVNLLGSRQAEFARAELDRRVGSWRARHPGVVVLLLDAV